MTRFLVSAVLVVATVTPVPAKVLCPPGRFVVRADMPGAALGDGTTLVLGAGDVTIGDGCRTRAHTRYHTPGGQWLSRVSARWRRCAGVRPVAVRARWELTDAPWCTRLEGVLRVGRRRAPFVADRVRECGNGLREPGEECDGADGTLRFGGDCCTPGCRVTSGPGCFRTCDTRFFPCDADEVCAFTCRSGRICRSPSDVACTGPVCACDGVTTFADRCAAFAAGEGVGSEGACPAPPVDVGP
jgi:hypothetical protein